MKLRVLLLNNVPAPYFTPLFETIGVESGWELTVCYSSDWNQAVGWQEALAQDTKAHRIVILDRQNGWLKRLLGGPMAAAAALLVTLFRERPEYLICYGYTLAPQMVALLWAMMTKTPFAVIGDTNYFADSATGVKRKVKTLWLRQITSRAAALIAVGTASRMFWEAYGGRAERLFDAGFAVDNQFYARASAASKGDAAVRRTQLGVTGKVVFLFVGRLVKRKNVDLIIKAAQTVVGDSIAVVIAGSGEQLESLKATAAGAPNIIFTGNVAPQDLPLYYAMSDVLVLPAEQEPWGLVINEAMACGLAIVAHKHCGAAVDLVDEKNGVVLHDYSVDEMARAMQKLAGDTALLQAMQRHSREKIQSWSITPAARGIMHAVETSLKNQ